MHFDVPYGCCFSYENDLVQQWNEYGDRGHGVSIGFDLSWFNIKRQLPITSSRISDAIGYEAVRYDSIQLREELYILIYYAIEQQGKNAWLLTILPTFKHYAGFIKNASFRDEKEIRILFYPSEHITDSFVGLSDLKYEIKPHYCFDWADQKTCAMRSVTVGYACEHSQKEIVELINQAGIAGTVNVPVYKSDCSYRNRIG